MSLPNDRYFFPKPILKPGDQIGMRSLSKMVDPVSDKDLAEGPANPRKQCEIWARVISVRKSETPNLVCTIIYGGLHIRKGDRAAINPRGSLGTLDGLIGQFEIIWHGKVPISDHAPEEALKWIDSQLAGPTK